MNIAFKFDHVSFSYDETPVLRDVTCSASSNQFVGLIGPNGGGKTTFLKLLMGFLKPSHGTIEILGKNPVEARGNMAYVPQNLRYDKLFPISVKELVLMGRLSHLSWWGRFGKTDEEAALEALRVVGMEEYATRAIGALSGGQLQRALIARALASKPKMLLLDEPTANVDVRVESDIYQLLRTLSKEITVVMVTHDLTEVVQLVDELFCVQGSVFSMKPCDVCNHFAFGLYHRPKGAL